MPGESEIRNSWPAPRKARPLVSSLNDRGMAQMSKFDSWTIAVPLRPPKLLAPTPNISRPVGASSTLATMSA